MTAWKPGSPVELTTERFRIRSAIPADVDAIYLAWFADRETMQFIGPDLARLTHEQHLAIVASADNRTRMFLMVEERAERRRVGWLRVEMEARHKRAQTSLVIGERAHRLRGARVEIHKAVRLFLFSAADVRKLTFSVYGAHTLMLEAHERNADIVKEGVLCRHDFVPGLGWQDVHVYAMFRDPPDEADVNAVRTTPRGSSSEN